MFLSGPARHCSRIHLEVELLDQVAVEPRALDDEARLGRWEARAARVHDREALSLVELEDDPRFVVAEEVVHVARLGDPIRRVSTACA